MENILEKPYLGRYKNQSIFINKGKFSPYLNYNNKLYPVPKCFQNDKFNLEAAIKIIDWKDEKDKEKKDEEETEVIKSADFKKDLKK